MISTFAQDETRANSAFERNLDAFRRHAPRLHSKLKAIDRPHSQLDVGPDGAIDIEFHGKKLYGRDAIAFTQEQLDKYFTAPARQFLTAPKVGAIPGLAGDYCSGLDAAAKAAGIGFDQNRVEDTAHFTFVFGVGLGLHLQPLADQTGCRSLAIIEPMIENIYHSLSVIDWCELFAPADGRERSVHFVIESDLETIASNLRAIVREQGASLLDGLYVYKHYPLTTLTRAYHQFKRDIHLHLVGLGFFEDEMVMTANTVGNLVRGDVRVIAAPLPVHDTPVILCGSGPSIDGCFEQIRRLQERAIVVSLGSSLRSLLAHGIRPDFHIEMENEIDNANNICKTDDEFGLQGITLVGSSTTQPFGVERFDDVILYFRARLSSSYLFAQGIDWLGSCGPTVANAGLISMLYLGFRNFHFFGVDMGSREIDRYHASDTFIGMGQAREWGSGQRFPVAANFGGVAYAEGVLRWSRLAIENVMHLHKDVRAINCSDGARIGGVIPMLPHVLEIDSDPVDRSDLRAMLDRHLPVFGARRRSNMWDRESEEQKLSDNLDRIDAILERELSRPDIGLDWLCEIYRAVQYDSKSPAAPAFLFGTFTLLVGTTWWYDRHVADPDQKQAFRRLAIAHMGASVGRVRERLKKLFDDVEAVCAGSLAAVEVDVMAPPEPATLPDLTAGD